MRWASLRPTRAASVATTAQLTGGLASGIPTLFATSAPTPSSRASRSTGDDPRAATAASASAGRTATARTFTGTPAALNAYFKTAGAIGYTTARDNTAARTLTTTVSDGSLSTQASSVINITPVNDAPTINPAATLGGGRVGTAYEITYDVLRAAINATDVDTASPSILIMAVDSGTVQKWNGTSWVTVSTAATAPLAQRRLSAGEKIRWVPPAGVSGDRPAFKAKARDGVLNSTVTAQVMIHLAPA
jgi:hypothetical protein